MAIGVSGAEFVGRPREREAVRRLVDELASGTPGLVLVSGEAGIGKTRLVAQAVEYAAERGLQVLVGHCVQLGTEGLAYAPLVEALRQLVRSDAEGLDAVLGPARELVMRLTSRGPLDDGDELSGSQVLELVLGLVERLSAVRPLLIVIEDLHWGDRSTLELAAFLAQNLRGMPVGLLFSYRSDEVDRRHPLRQLLTSWDRARLGTRLELARLDRAELRALLAGILGTDPEEAVLDAVYERSEGNAFLAEELLSVVRSGDPEGLPPSLRELLLARLDGLEPATVDVLRLAAIAGRSVPERLLVAASGQPEAEVLAAIREAVEAHLLIVDEMGVGYRFRHALTRDAVYDDMLPGERVALHGRYARVLAARPELLDGSGLSGAASLAHHAFAARELPTALGASIAAGREASRQFAAHEARAHYERAVRIWSQLDAGQRPEEFDRAELLRLAAAAAFGAGDLDPALELAQQARAELGEEDHERRAELALSTGTVLLSLGRARDAVELLSGELAGLPERATARRADLEAALAATLLRVLDLEGSAASASRAVESARATGRIRAEADALITLGVSFGLQGDEAGIDRLREGIARATEAGDSFIMARGYTNLADLLESWGRSAEAIAAATPGIASAERSGVLRTIGAYLAANLAESRLRLGEWAEAEALLSDSLRRLPEGVFEASAQLLRGELALLRGDLATLPGILESLRRLPIDPDDEQFRMPIAQLEVELHRVARDFDAARREALDAVGMPEHHPALTRYLWPVIWAGLRAEAERVAVTGDEPDPVLVALAGSLATPTPPTLGYRDLALAELAGVADPEPWRAAVAAWRRVGWPWQLGYALLRLAEATAEAGELDAARAPLLEAHGIAASLGAEPLATGARRLAQRTRIVLADPDAVAAAEQADPLQRYGLTTREREVLMLVAAGRSNPEIARELFISGKTASTHVSNILAKLGLEGRVAAAGLVHRLGLAD
ncbi:helix-turn-helix transcriptional regulator [Protaetiibacter intestinalis]|uniref:HTH luxR-type domain-containing protein n=1 Tax=Protaetiibacter intestinalis TaxID=2419774 RepID=A0A387B6L5_9MICO|nr:AAA family ATPase [Protaetiibacter intestinalis]AYF97401.1 hypothetical protein D7I47_03470 [Protaetiibacter intestinalis]